MSYRRRLSDGEATFALMHRHLAGSTQVTTLVSLNRVVRLSAIADAFEAVRRDTLLLRLRIVDDGGELFFVEDAARAAAVTVLEWPPAAPPSMSPVDDLLRGELNRTLDPHGPPWRVGVALDQTGGATHILWTRDHAISDGHTTTMVLSALLRRLFPAPGSAPVPPPPGVLPEIRGHSYAAPLPVDQLREPTGTGTTIPFDAVAPLSARQAGYVPIPLTQAHSRRIMAYARAHGITINQFFAALLTAAWRHVTDRAEGTVHTAISLRKRYPPLASGALLGCLIGVIPCVIPPGAADLAPLARRYGAGLRAADSLWRPVDRPHRRVREDVEALGTRTGHAGICITNVGALDHALAPFAATIGAVRTVVNRRSGNYGVVLHLSSLGGHFTASLAHGVPCVAASTVADMARHAVALVDILPGGMETEPLLPPLPEHFQHPVKGTFN